MAETLANGTVVPQGSDPIHANGVQWGRNMGGSIDGQLGNRYTKAQADALLAGKAPATHTHDDRYYTEAEIDQKIAAVIEGLSFNTGWITVTPDAGVTGTIKVKREGGGGGDRTTIRLEGVLPPAGVGSAYLAILPAGFRHTIEHWFLADGRSGEVPSVIGLYNGSRAAWVMTVAGGTTRPTDPITGEYTWESPDARPAI